MSELKILQSAPSNIALIKYMGKIEGTGNKPTNASISYSLDHLRTYVEIEQTNKSQDLWSPLRGPQFYPLDLSEKGQTKFLSFFKKLKEHWNLSEMNFSVRSGNTFPSDCGLASSASSFAALTKASAEVFQKVKPLPKANEALYLSALSRQGSGSSCRSFFSPWALWREEGAEPVAFDVKLHSAVILLEKGKKEVSSSEAHRRVLTSPRFQGRIERAELKLKDLMQSIPQHQWKLSYEIIWDEFWDMHELFHTSQPGFSYLTKECREILQWTENQWKKMGHGPWVTLDAGPNIHLLFAEQDLKFADQYLKEFKNYSTLTSWKST